MKTVRRIINGTAYDTATAEKIVTVNGHPEIAPEECATLYRTRNGAFFLWGSFVTPAYNVATELVPLSDDKAQKWLEDNANELVEKYFGAMPEGGAAERRITLRMPNNLAERIEGIAGEKKISMNRYILQCLESAAAGDGKPVVPV
jgi:predicted HicB family RNase H-like nuclease